MKADEAEQIKAHAQAIAFYNAKLALNIALTEQSQS